MIGATALAHTNNPFMKSILKEWAVIWPWVRFFVHEIIDSTIIWPPDSPQEDMHILLGELIPAVVTELAFGAESHGVEDSLLNTPGYVSVATDLWIQSMRHEHEDTEVDFLRLDRMYIPLITVVDTPERRRTTEMAKVMDSASDFVPLLLNHLMRSVECPALDACQLHTTLRLLRSFTSNSTGAHSKLINSRSIPVILFVIRRLVARESDSYKYPHAIPLCLKVSAEYLRESYSSSPMGLDWILELLNPNFRFFQLVLKAGHAIYCQWFTTFECVIRALRPALKRVEFRNRYHRFCSALNHAIWAREEYFEQIRPRTLCSGPQCEGQALVDTSSDLPLPSSVKCCSGCRVTYYCFRECQKQDWKIRHQGACSSIRVDYSKSRLEKQFTEYSAARLTVSREQGNMETLRYSWSSSPAERG
ncbi:hypothetical protein C8J56DRAFT_1020156 [Mycena floridula]|nr:hypothetical protein C8J56DRAFT_1020156 [Mycena floridula]